MEMKTVYIKDDKFDYSFRLIICDARKQMGAAIEKDDIREYGKIENEASFDKDTMGMFRTTYSKLEPAADGEFCSSVFGTMYLNIDDIKAEGDEIIYHECGHCAIAHETRCVRYFGSYETNDNHDDNERFCDYLGRMTSKVKDAVADYKKAGKK
jgi:hypothetical protein